MISQWSRLASGSTLTPIDIVTCLFQLPTKKSGGCWRRAKKAGCGCSHEANSISIRLKRGGRQFPTPRRKFTSRTHKISYLSTMRRFRIRRTRIQWSRPRTASISARHRPCPQCRGRCIINSQSLVRSLAPPKIILGQFRPVGSRNQCTL